MIDSVAMVWGQALGTAERRVDRPLSGRSAEPAAAPVRLDFPELIERLGSDEGQVRAVKYGDAMPLFGHWKVGAVELLYREGRVELRASLPKLLTGRNDVVLDAAGVHDGFRALVRTGVELTQHPLELREATPARLDYAYQWQVSSVAFTLEHLRSALAPPRKLRTDHVAPAGGRSLVYGYGSKRVIRFYDKVGELAAHGEESEHELDTLLRYEIQERRRPRLRLIHEQGYRAEDVRRELAGTIGALGAVAQRNVEQIVADAAASAWRHRLAYDLGCLYLTEHEEAFAVLRAHLSKPSYYRWRKRAREIAIAVGDWTPTIPEDAFDTGASLWTGGAAAAA